MYVDYIHAWYPQRSEEGIAPLALESQMVVNYCVGARIIIYIYQIKTTHYIHSNIILETLKINLSSSQETWKVLKRKAAHISKGSRAQYT